MRKAKLLLINSLLNKSSAVWFDGKRYFFNHSKTLLNENLGVAIELRGGMRTTNQETVFLVENPFRDFNFHYQVISKKTNLSVSVKLVGKTPSGLIAIFLEDIDLDGEYLFLIHRYVKC